MAVRPAPDNKRRLAAADPEGGLQHGSSGSSHSINGSERSNGEKAKLLPPARPPNPEDPKDKGKTPLTVQRHCTDVVWNFPFLALLATCCWITHKAYEVGKPQTIFRLPDFASHLCGTGSKEGANFLYFCMKRDSEWVFDEANKRLESRYPICVKQCPRSFNTSSHCYMGNGEVDDVNAWDFIQDYPTQPMAYFCRPHRSYSKGLNDDFWKAVRKGPATSYLMVALYNGWPQVSVACIMSSALFSFFYIVSLSKCARGLIWLSLTVIMLFSGTLCALYGYCFKTGNCQNFTGNTKDDPVDLLRCVACGIVSLWILRIMSNLSRQLDLVGRIMEMACRCIMSSPMLSVLPMFILAWRIILTSWVLYVILCLYSDEIHDRLDGIEQPWVAGWSRLPSVNKSMEFRVYVIIAIFYYVWAVGTVTAYSWFIMIFVGQVWYFARERFGGAQCNVLRAFYTCMRYHSGTMALAGLLHVFVGPLHATFGKLQAAERGGNPLASILHTCLSCCMDCYGHTLSHLHRNALQDVSLQAFDFFESANHMADEENGPSLAEEVAVLHTSTFLFQAAGVGGAGVIAWFATARILSAQHFNDEDSQFYVEDKSLLCAGGVCLSLLCALPFMTIFDVVSDAVLYSKVVDRQRNHKRTMQGSASMIFRNCAPWSQTIRDITSCNCAYRNGFESSGAPSWGSMSWQVQGSQSMPATVPASPFIQSPPP